MPRRISKPPLKRWMRSRRFWAALPAVVLVLMLGLVAVAGQIFARMMESPDIGDLRRSQTMIALDGATRISYIASAGSPQASNGVPVVYVHGTPGDATNFLAFVRRPVDGRFSLAIDRPGFGQSRHDRAFVSFADQARALIAVLDAEGISRAVLVGHSLGGPIVARAAADCPDRVAAIVEAAGSLDPGLEELKWYNQLLRIWPVTKLLPHAFIWSNEEVLAAKAQCEELATVLDRVRCPVMIVHGTADRLVPYSNVDYMRAHFSNAERVELRTLEGADHFLPWAQESQLRDAIAEAVDWVAAAATAESN